jgi:hypothetical protein
MAFDAEDVPDATDVGNLDATAASLDGEDALDARGLDSSDATAAVFAVYECLDQSLAAEA